MPQAHRRKESPLMEGSQELGLAGYFVPKGGDEFSQPVDRMGIAAAGYRQTQETRYPHCELILFIGRPAVRALYGVGQPENRMVQGAFRCVGNRVR